MEKLTTSNCVTLVGGIGAAVLTASLHLLIFFYQKADVRYEEQPVYRSGGEAVCCLKVHNYGWSDAKDIVVSVTLPKPLVKPPTTNDETFPFQVTGGKAG